jgi:HEAT repeat protein
MKTENLNKLIKNLSDNDPSKRRSAAQALSDGDDRAVYPLIKALRDNNTGVQDAVVHSLMEIKKESTVYMILPLLREDIFLRNTALLILREMGKIATPLLYNLLSDKDDDVRKFALDLIYDISHCTYPEKVAQMLSEDPNANVRAAAAKALGRLKYEKALPQLLQSLNDEEWVSFSTLEVLPNFKDDRSTDSIIELLNSPSESIRLAAIEALGKTATAHSVQGLSDHFSRAKGYEKISTIKYLAETGSLMGTAEVLEILQDMLRHDDWEDKLAAIKGFASLENQNAIYHMVDTAGSLDRSHPDNEERVRTIKKEILRFACIPSLIALLDDKSIRYRGKVVILEVLGHLKCREAVPKIISLLNNLLRDVRRTGISVLGEIGGEEAKDCLMETLTDHDSHVRKTSITVLGEIGGKKAFKPIMNVLKNEQYTDVIDECITALLKIDSDLFLSHINDLKEYIREAAGRLASHVDLEHS